MHCVLRFGGSLVDAHCALYKFTYLLTYCSGNVYSLTPAPVTWETVPYPGNTFVWKLTLFTHAANIQ